MELADLRRAILSLEDGEVRQLLLLLFMKAEKSHGDYDAEVMDIAEALIETFKEQTEEINIQHVHIVFSERVAGQLRQAFRQKDLLKTEAIIYFPDILSVGPVTELHTMHGIEHRYQWFDENFHSSEVEGKKQAFIQAIKEIQMIKNKEKIIVWTCHNAHEQTGLRLVMALLQNHMNAISIINSFETFHQLYNFPQMREDGLPRLTEDLDGEQLVYMYNRSKHMTISNDIRGALCESGFEILATENVLRSWVNNEIVHEEQTRDDMQLMAIIKDYQKDEERFIKASRVVDEAVHELPQYCGASWFEYRLKMLIANGSLQYQGDLSSARLYEVKC